MLRSKTLGSGGFGNGDARYTAVSIERLTAASPLQRPMLTDTTSPPGNCLILTMHSMPAVAVGGFTVAAFINPELWPFAIALGLLYFGVKVYESF